MTFSRLDLDNYLKSVIRVLRVLDATEFGTLRNRAYKRAMAEYQAKLITQNDPYIRRDTFSESTAPSTGTVKADTSIGDVYVLTLITGAVAIADDSIILHQSTGVFKRVPRIDIDELTPGGTGETLYGFVENKGKIWLYVKDATFTAPGTLHYNYYIALTVDPSGDSDVLDFKPEDYFQIFSATAQYIKEELDLS